MLINVYAVISIFADEEQSVAVEFANTVSPKHFFLSLHTLAIITSLSLEGMAQSRCS